MFGEIGLQIDVWNDAFERVGFKKDGNIFFQWFFEYARVQASRVIQYTHFIILVKMEKFILDSIVTFFEINKV